MNNDTPADAMQLKPCPFCGEHCAALVVDQGDKWAHYEPSCLEVRTGYDLGDNAPWRAELSAAWNTRTTSLAAQDGLVDALRKALNLAVMTLAFIGRDQGTTRIEATLDGLCELAKEADPIIRAALASIEVKSSPLEQMVALDEELEQRYPGWMTGDKS